MPVRAAQSVNIYAYLSHIIRHAFLVLSSRSSSMQGRFVFLKKKLAAKTLIYNELRGLYVVEYNRGIASYCWVNYNSAKLEATSTFCVHRLAAGSILVSIIL